VTARLFVTCGLPGAGKTTLAKQLERDHDAIRFSPDEWMTDLWDQPTRALIERQMWRVAQRVLALGGNVVIDFGSWARAERDELREGARRLGVAVELHYLDVPIDELVRRVDARAREGITRAHLEEWQQLIEVPTPEELALFDPSTS
jgi:predicted kinase